MWYILSLFPVSLLHWVLPTVAQYPASVDNDRDNKVTHFSADSNITIRYKSPAPGTCATTFANQKQYTGYVHLPPSTLAPIKQNYDINTFFWFVEAREHPESAPLTIYLNGGPGSSSMVGLFLQTGPCEVVEAGKNKLSTRAREWSWDRSSNLLFIDQPVQSGFSFDTLTNGSLDLITSEYISSPMESPRNQAPYTFLNGTFSSHNTSMLTNTTATSAMASWHMLQAFLGVFPQYNPGARKKSGKSSKSAGVHFFSESYGGVYGPEFATYWIEQNDRLKNGEFNGSKALEIDLQSVGILQGCIDHLIQDPYYPIFARNNTYNIEALSEEQAQASLAAFSKLGGCQDMLQRCRNLAQTKDPNGYGDVSEVDNTCFMALMACNESMISPYSNFNRSNYDIAQGVLNPFPPSWHLEYLNTAAVQAAIGTPMNYTDYSATVQEALAYSGDFTRTMHIPQLAVLLDRGIRIALIHGDRDYICNWYGGEAVSFAIAANTTTTTTSSPSSSYANNFNSAGYAPVLVNSTYTGGAVRQYGNLSFTRVYDSGHFTASYQPETVYQLFARIIAGRDMASGAEVDLASFKTSGEANATKTNVAPPMARSTCFLRNVKGTCTSVQTEMLKKGEGVVVNGVWYEREEDWVGPE
ncbi:hypothetical protein AJ80_07844 [Polytolypa hystricis UAMH7299]|uniref:Carboxypeptidase n=1 Tax=Polytolypa hystricis (strain UAMH7299) TaxID=1447883 RepID=A0A2B7XA51_POLH7|nr:hypothetical protein AJ80_07844 [Polytolypa hystricis UAMH7299]